jgi:hypothetical protein
MNAYPTLTETIEAALEISEIFMNINKAVVSGELTAAKAEQLKLDIMRG